MQGIGEEWLRSGNRYRDNVAGAKYQVIKVDENNQQPDMFA